MNNIVLVGCGQLGSRHLQGLSKLEGNNNIIVIDPSEAALKNASERLKEAGDKNIDNKYSFVGSLDILPEAIDLAVIATNSDTRKMVLDKLITSAEVKNLLLEKFLFQRKDDYYQTQSLLNTNKINTWVNCARRLYPEFKELKSEIKNKKVLEVNVYGSNWNFTSNAIHFIDLIAFLTDSDEYSITENKLFDHIYENKRKGFVEFNGKLIGRFSNETFFNLSCYPFNTVSVYIEIMLEDGIYMIDQIEQKLSIHRKNGEEWENEEKRFPNHYQSNLTNIAAHQILTENRSDLTSYKESMKLHLPLLDIFKEHLQKLSNQSEIEKCPIT